MKSLIFIDIYKGIHCVNILQWMPTNINRYIFDSKWNWYFAVNTDFMKKVKKNSTKNYNQIKKIILFVKTNKILGA